MVFNALECIDYVNEVEKVPMMPFESTADQLELNQKGTQIRDLPTSAETLVATVPDATLYHKEKVKIEMLAGTIQQKYMPLHKRRKTWTDLNDLDITKNRELAKELIHTHKQDQIKVEAIHQSFEGYVKAVEDYDYYL